MPDTKRSGSYANGTKPVLQGKAGNKSQQDLDAMRLSSANSGAALRKVVPVGNKAYEEFQRTRHTPAGLAEKDAYERTNKLPRLSDADYQQRRFNEGTEQLKQQASLLPGQSVFSGTATDAAYATQRDAAVRLGNFAETDGRAATNASIADRFSRLPNQSAYTAPGVASGTIQKDMGDSTPSKKKMMIGGPAIATYKDGTKGVKTKPTPSNDPYAPGFTGPPRYGDTEESLDTVAAEQPVPTSIPSIASPVRKIGTSPKTYQDAAKVLRSDKALMAQYHAGVASGKAFSLNIGGKSFSYAATAKPGASKTPAAKPVAKTTTDDLGTPAGPGGDIRKARMQEADEMSQVAVAKLPTTRAASPKATTKKVGTPLNASTSPTLLQEDAENANLRRPVRKMALAKR